VDTTECLDPAFVLKLFERGRTDHIGGSEVLKRLLVRRRRVGYTLRAYRVCGPISQGPGGLHE